MKIGADELSELVCCEDCKFIRWNEDEGYYYCALEDRPNRNWSVDKTDFCSWGERKEIMTKQEAVELLKERGFMRCDFENCFGECDNCYEALNMAIEALRQEPKRGKWVYDAEAYPCGNPYGHYDCDQCGESVPSKTNYCPNCGSRMESDTQ